MRVLSTILNAFCKVSNNGGNFVLDILGVCCCIFLINFNDKNNFFLLISLLILIIIILFCIASGLKLSSTSGSNLL